MRPIFRYSEGDFHFFLSCKFVLETRNKALAMALPPHRNAADATVVGQNIGNESVGDRAASANTGKPTKSTKPAGFRLCAQCTAELCACDLYVFHNTFFFFVFFFALSCRSGTAEK